LHERHHADESGHLVIQSFEPGEDWFYDFGTDAFLVGPPLARPRSHPADQPVPGPQGRVPADWQSKLN
jgi:hypothetical protein